MYLLYSLALSLLFLALLPYFLYQAVRHGKYAGSFKQRMGRLPEAVRANGRNTIWVHAVSVGELLAAKPLIDRLKVQFAGCRIVVSTTTLTGHRLASQTLDGVFYFPFDWRFTVRLALEWVRPIAVIILETEIWPNFLRECRNRGVVTVLANGRISLRSLRRYKRVGPLISRALEDFSLMVMQSEADAERARELGARDRIKVCGNLKYDVNVDQPLVAVTSRAGSEISKSEGRETADLGADLDRRFALSTSPHLIVAGSTAPEEESLLLAALSEVREHTGLQQTRLVIAPRHPERFNEVASLIARSTFHFVRRSRAIASTAEAGGTRADPSSEEDAAVDQGADVILLDTIGELATIYRFATVVFVGGSLVPRGGHNIIEPAAFAKPIIVGSHTENFHQIVSDFARRGALVQITARGGERVKSLARELIHLLSAREEALAMGERAREILHANRGATQCTMVAIGEILGPRIESAVR
jgi:3-deoxy-D-manno-octulosonic-acid transferase